MLLNAQYFHPRSRILMMMAILLALILQITKVFGTTVSISNDIIFNAVQNLTFTLSDCPPNFFDPGFVLAAQYSIRSYLGNVLDPSISYPLRPVDAYGDYISIHINGGYDAINNDHASSCYYLSPTDDLYYVGDMYIPSDSNSDYSLYRFDFSNNLSVEMLNSVISASSFRVQCNNVMRGPLTTLNEGKILWHLSRSSLLIIDAKFYDATAISYSLLTVSSATLKLQSSPISLIVENNFKDELTTNIVMKFTPADVGFYYLNIPMDSLQLPPISDHAMIINSAGTSVAALHIGPAKGFSPTYSDNTVDPTDWKVDPNDSVYHLPHLTPGFDMFTTLRLFVPHIGDEVILSLDVPSTSLTSGFFSLSSLPISTIFSYTQMNGRPYLDPKYLFSAGGHVQHWNLATPPAASEAFTPISIPMKPLLLSVLSTDYSIPMVSETISARKRSLVKMTMSGDFSSLASMSLIGTISLFIEPRIFDRSGVSSELNNPNSYRPFTVQDFDYNLINIADLNVLSSQSMTSFSFTVDSNSLDSPQLIDLYLPLFSKKTFWAFFCQITVKLSSTTFKQINLPVVSNQNVDSPLLPTISVSSGKNPLPMAFSDLTALETANAGVTSLSLSSAVTTHKDYAITWITPLSTTNPKLEGLTNISGFVDPITFDSLIFLLAFDQAVDIDTVIAKGQCQATFNEDNNNLQLIISPSLFIPRNEYDAQVLNMVSSSLIALNIPISSFDASEWSRKNVQLSIFCFFPNAVTNPIALKGSRTRLIVIQPNDLPSSIHNIAFSQDAQLTKLFQVISGTTLDSSTSYTASRIWFRNTLSLTATIEAQLIDMIYNGVWSVKNNLDNTIASLSTLQEFKDTFIIKIVAFSTARHPETNYSTPRVMKNSKIALKPFVGPSAPFELYTYVDYIAYKVNPSDVNDFSNTAAFSGIDPTITSQYLVMLNGISSSPYFSTLRDSLRSLQGLTSNTNVLSRKEWNRVSLVGCFNTAEGLTFHQNNIDLAILKYQKDFGPSTTRYRYDDACFSRERGTCGSKARGDTSTVPCPISCPAVVQDNPLLRTPVPEALGCQFNTDCSYSFLTGRSAFDSCNKVIRRCTTEIYQNYWNTRQWPAFSDFSRSYTFPTPDSMDASDEYESEKNFISLNTCKSSPVFDGFGCSIPLINLANLVIHIKNQADPAYIQSGDSFTLKWNYNGKGSPPVSVSFVVRDNLTNQELFNILYSLPVEANALTVTVVIPNPISGFSIPPNAIVGFELTVSAVDPTYTDTVALKSFIDMGHIIQAIVASCRTTNGSNKCFNSGACNVSGLCSCPVGYSPIDFCLTPSHPACPLGVCPVPSDTDGSDCESIQKFGADCDFTSLTITDGNPNGSLPQPPIISPPHQQISLPNTIFPLNDICDKIIDTSGNEVSFAPEYADMCSIPTAGSLLVKIRPIDTTLDDNTHKNEYICDCLCKGYWVDNSETRDYKKCSKCSLSCPFLMTPNEECTACECVSEECLSITAAAKMASPTTPSSGVDIIQFFSAIYFDLAVLDIIQHPYTHDVSTSLIPGQFIKIKALDETPANQMRYAHDNYLSGASTQTRNLYYNIMQSIADAIRLQMIDDVLSIHPELKEEDIILDISIMPLVQSSYLIWKLIYISRLMNKSYFFAPLDATFISSALLNAITKHKPAILPTDIITVDSTHLVNLITIPTDFAYQDHVTTRCAISTAVGTLSPTKPITVEDLSECPLASEYMVFKQSTGAKNKKTDVIDQEMTISANPLWSKCTQNSYRLYEGLFTSEIRQLYTREIYPFCFDFYGKNVGGSDHYYIPCTYDLSTSNGIDQLLYYSQENDKILIPFYLQRIFQSIDLNLVKNVEVNSLIARYKTQYLPQYPKFPQVTTVICDPQEYETTASQPSPTIPISFPPTGMTSTPTQLSPSSHAHIGWSFGGTDQTTITLTAKPTSLITSPSTSTPKNTTQFLWSQIIGEPQPSSSLHSTTQIPTITESTLFGQIYSEINNYKNSTHPLVTMYTKNDFSINGFINQAATMTSTHSSTSHSFTLRLPMHCDLSNITCPDTISQFCNQATGRCECREAYIIDPTRTSSCLSVCQNNGKYNYTTSSCDCVTSNESGKFCEITQHCHPDHLSFADQAILDKIDLDQSLSPQFNQSIANVYTSQCNNGYYPYSILFDQSGDKQEYCGQNNACTCFSPFWNTTEATSTTPESPCSTCLLKPLQTETRDNQVANVGIQRCYVTGTDPRTYEDGQCAQCICRKGYSGDYCHIHTTYARFKYTGNEQKYLYDSVNEAVLFDKFAHEVMLSMTHYDKSKISVYEHNLKDKYVIIAIQTDVDFFQRNAEQSFQITQASRSLFSTFSLAFTTLGQSIPLPSSTRDLYQQWLDMQKNFEKTPINNQDSDNFLGGIQPPKDAGVYDPSCKEQGYADCSPITNFFPQDQNTSKSHVGMIVGIVVAFICVVLFFILMIFLVKYAKKNEKWCFQKRKDNTFKVQDNRFKGSTALPSDVSSTISIMSLNITPLSVENTAESIKSVNNHSEVNDPTLDGTDWKAYQNGKSEKFYVNQTTMESRWKHPLKPDNDDDKGW